VCTYTTERLSVRGSGKAAGKWSSLTSASVYVDHPCTTPLEHTLNIDLFSESGSRPIALELSLESADALVDSISRAMTAARQARTETQRVVAGITVGDG
jgi:hypothetical protein